MIVTRRNFLRGLAGSAALTALPTSGFASALDSINEHHTIKLHSIHTGETGKFDIMVNGEFVAEELARADKLLRDHRTGDVEKMDQEALRLLAKIAKKTENSKGFNIISGYRSPASNAMLAANSGGVAKKSYHMRGMAIDIALPGTDLNHLHNAAKSLKIGGVGKYSGSGFVHVDTGPVRYWGA
ncbi:MAG: hypothetical protein CMM93_05400 [Rickettsiales bacterium]|nr:hypothetical protein [Rickettsiales bacterium]|tara:strand:+ start:911 stop:1462 length:552 start_codon:yes stop_codon:yes gene_type:complete